MTTCSKCNKGDRRKTSKNKFALDVCSNTDCEDSFYQKVIVGGGPQK